MTVRVRDLVREEPTQYDRPTRWESLLQTVIDEHAGHWVRILSTEKKNSASAQVSRLKSARMRKPGVVGSSWEFVYSPLKNGRWGVYARYTEES